MILAVVDNGRSDTTVDEVRACAMRDPSVLLTRGDYRRPAGERFQPVAGSAASRL